MIPEAAMKAHKQPRKTLPRSPGNEREWLDACRGSKTKPGANVEFSGLLTETLMLGNIALRAGVKLIWDRANLKVVNVALNPGDESRDANAGFPPARHGRIKPAVLSHSRRRPDHANQGV